MIKWWNLIQHFSANKGDEDQSLAPIFWIQVSIFCIVVYYITRICKIVDLYYVVLHQQIVVTLGEIDLFRLLQMLWYLMNVIEIWENVNKTLRL